MIDDRVKALGGARMTLAQMKKRHGAPVPDKVVAAEPRIDGLTQFLVKATEEAAQAAREESKEIIDGLNEKLAHLKAQMATELSLFNQVKRTLEARLADLSNENAAYVSRETALAASYAQEKETAKATAADMAIQRAVIVDLEIKLANAAGQISQLETRLTSPPAPIVPSVVVSERKMPSFRFKPIMNDSGDIIEITAIPMKDVS